MVNSTSDFLRATRRWLHQRGVRIGHPTSGIYATTMDFTDLYMKLDRDFIISQVERLGRHCQDPLLPALVHAIRVLFNFSHFSWHGRLYRQEVDIPMGTNCGPTLANVTMLGPFIPDSSNPTYVQHSTTQYLMLRYIDDVFIG